MPELQFVGKEFVYNHHLTVPYRPFVIHPDKSIVADGDVNGASLDDNLIVQGDNLHALKALLPRYAGKVDCIFIDPPYNTGNEGWAYNDNVNGPLMRDWLDQTVGLEDGLRHDKWCCMMWPRLRLLTELLSPNGLLWISIDDVEAHRLRLMLDELLGEGALVAQFIWKSRLNQDNRNKNGVSVDHEYLLCYGKEVSGRTRTGQGYANPDDDVDGPWTSGNMVGMATLERRPRLHYCFMNPDTGLWYNCPPNGWRYNWKSMSALIKARKILWPKDATGRPREKSYLKDLPDSTNIPSLILDGPYNVDGTRELVGVLGSQLFDFPKPSKLVEFVVGQSGGDGILVLDSFAGSGTTAHAVLNLNAKDGGNRRFILVECENYADTLTAERVRRVINGYPYSGTQRETLFEKKLNWTALQKGEQLIQEAKNTANLFEGSYDEIETKVDDGTLKVVGIRKVKEHTTGLGGGFTYCTLGEPLDIDRLLTEDDLPSHENISAWLIQTAFGTTIPKSADFRGEGLDEWYVGQTDTHHVWVIYRPERSFLQSKDSCLTYDLAAQIAARNSDRPHMVFATAKYVGKASLDPLKVSFAPLPFALYRLERSSE